MFHYGRAPSQVQTCSRHFSTGFVLDWLRPREAQRSGVGSRSNFAVSVALFSGDLNILSRYLVMICPSGRSARLLFAIFAFARRGSFRLLLTYIYNDTLFRPVGHHHASVLTSEMLKIDKRIIIVIIGMLHAVLQLVS